MTESGVRALSDDPSSRGAAPDSSPADARPSISSLLGGPRSIPSLARLAPALPGGAHPLRRVPDTPLADGQEHLLKTAERHADNSRSPDPILIHV